MPQVLRCAVLLLFWFLSGAMPAKGANPVVISAGYFTMGSAVGESDEQPPHPVTIRSFAISPYEVTESHYDSCVAAGRCTPAHYDDGGCRAWTGGSFRTVRIPSSVRRADFPVVCVTWHQAQQYCRSNGMQLPSEAEWEYAARGGSVGRYPWGDALPTANQSVISSSSGPKPVGTCPPNNRGLFDMTGNVWEWVRDSYAPDTYKNDSAVSSAGFYRVIRGGGWYSNPAQATVTNREWFSPDFGEVSIGFRCVAPQ